MAGFSMAVNAVEDGGDDIDRVVTCRRGIAEQARIVTILSALGIVAMAGGAVGGKDLRAGVITLQSVGIVLAAESGHVIAC
ncbi:hypothetical protein D3C87_1832520 [compost metagenome]